MNIKRIFWIVLVCCCVVTAVGQTYRVGDVYTAPDGSQGIVYYLLPDGSGGWVVALNDVSEGCQWGTYENVQDLPDQSSNYYQLLMNDTSGYTNTQIIRASQNNNPNYAAGKVEFGNGWYLPSPAQLRMLFARLPFISSALENAGGSDMSSASYWSSAEYVSSYAWGVSFLEGTAGYFEIYPKSSNFCHVRAVRSFSYPTYQWNSGETTSGITTVAQSGAQHTVSVTNGGGCTSVVTHHPVLACVQDLEIVLSADTVCVGDSVVLQAVLGDAELSTPPIAPPIASGDILCTDGSIVKPASFSTSGKTALGIVFFVDSTGSHGWAMDLHDLDQNYPWISDTNSYFDVSTLDNVDSSRNAIADFDGYGNTLKLRAAGDSILLPAAWAVDFDHGWYLPAIGQLTQLYAQIMLLNASLQTAGGTPIPMNESYFYWSSTENDMRNAWNLVYGGSPRADFKIHSRLIRSVRNF